jgi:hypothetical protein
MFRTSMSLDRSSRALTVAVCLAAAAGLVAMVTAPRLGALRDSLTVLLVVLLALCWAMSPRALIIDAGELRIERRAWRSLRVPLTSVESASALECIGPGALRVFGVGGFFGSYGLFWTRVLGRFRLYATRQGQALIVRRTGKALPIVLTPDDVAGAVHALRARAVR